MDIKSRRIPYAYKELEYIESTGTQYINIGKVSADFDELSIAFQFTSHSQWATIFGAWNTSSSVQNLYLQADAYSQYFNFRVSDEIYFDDIALDTAKHTFYYSSSYSSATLDNTSVSVTPSTFTIPMTIGGLNGESTVEYKPSARYYSFVLKKSGSIIMNLVPAKRISDSVVGMFDTYSCQFFTNAVTDGDNFTAGPEVITAESILLNNNSVKQLALNNKTFWTEYTVPMLYTQKNYIQSTGSQWIDTGITVNQSNITTTVFDIDAIFTTGSTNGANGKDLGGYMFIGIRTSGKAYAYFGVDSSGTYRFDSPDVVTNIRHTYEISGITKVFSIDGTSVGTYTSSTSSITAGNLFLGAVNNSGSTAASYFIKEKIYGCKIWQNGSLVRDMLPVIRNTDSKPGLYDKVTDTFFINLATSGDDFGVG